MIGIIRPTIIEAGRHDLLDKVRHVEEWLEKAKAEEAVHGKGCLVEFDHPSIQDFHRSHHRRRMEDDATCREQAAYFE